MQLDANSWVQNCEWYKIAKGPYAEPSSLQVSLVAYNPLDLVCMDFTHICLS